MARIPTFVEAYRLPPPRNPTETLAQTTALHWAVVQALITGEVPGTGAVEMHARTLYHHARRACRAPWHEDQLQPDQDFPRDSPP